MPVQLTLRDACRITWDKAISYPSWYTLYRYQSTPGANWSYLILSGLPDLGKPETLLTVRPDGRITCWTKEVEDLLNE